MKKIDKKLLISIFILIIIMITGFYFFTKEDDETDISYNTIFDNSNETKKSLDEEKIFVHIDGQVVSPGLISLQNGARISDAISAARRFDRFSKSCKSKPCIFAKRWSKNLYP
mgnify:FL=1